MDGILLNAETTFRGIGIRMPDMLRDLLRRLFTRAYQAGAEAQREAIILELSGTEEGRKLLARGALKPPHQSP
jgi:hypothetical protein